jgi:hypothetical protein
MVSSRLFDSSCGEGSRDGYRIEKRPRLFAWPEWLMSDVPVGAGADYFFAMRATSLNPIRG